MRDKTNKKKCKIYLKKKITKLDQQRKNTKEH